MNQDIISDPIEFEWDSGNKDKNFIKHGIAVEEAEEVFVSDPVIWEDEKHSGHEQRYQCLGVSKEGRKLFASFTIREKKVRIISVRLMNKKERSVYEKET